MLAEEENVHLSRETVRLWLRAEGLGRKVRRVKVHRRRRQRKEREGEMLFLDGGPGKSGSGEFDLVRDSTR